MKYPEITLRRGKEQSLQRLHPWVFSGAVAHIPDSLEEGDIVDVITCDGRKIATGHYQIGSITIRILSWEDTEINDAFYRKRLEAAYGLRQALRLVTRHNNAYRLVHGEGDFLPGLVIDVYGDTAVLQAHSPGMHFARDIIARQLTQLPDAGIRNVYYKSETTLPYKAHLDPQNDYIIGQYSTNIAEENGLKFHVDWLKGQKTGFFVDQRDNRALLEKYAYKRKVLNMFCYTGGFSVYALRGGAAEVHSVDSSAKAITLTDANVSLNFPDDTRHTSHVEDAFKYLSSIDDSYDLIILDPPAFAKHRSALKNALIGYRKLNAKAFEKIAPGGILFTFSCSQAVSREQFRLAVFSAAAQSQRKVRILHQLTQPADHPVNIYHPEGEYLKGLILYVE
ncbi:MAG TPA: class I SAM-dependent rRNA methyltransferase [Muribaculum sp.]|mgnify:CR=1 FL=1|jgi:23S rRNA (cytosine1962-C5)-methyltransferase|uniref:Class I SAM-dependent rRNA methyltransferase n=1 Tax=Heminiphilus faecis TaxID=2601703 RepID=A0ABV4CSP3_9BACT|nr:class I SAM-dependent rRNA methyltransferase [Heminiphilus faecis]RLT77608.1 class I SAM-dependent rRNA methyltransferase [bacterium J10(2018)]HRF67928.1 class I SAM-dependent rRNA methyltransferase [Muribaculum sp.]